jgi:hypothetical protein
MKKYLFILAALILLVGVGKAEAAGTFDCDGYLGKVLNKCVEHPANPEQEPNREQFDYGLYLHLILWQDENNRWEVGNWNTWEINRGELTSLVGVKVYLNRLTYQGE